MNERIAGISFPNHAWAEGDEVAITPTSLSSSFEIYVELRPAGGGPTRGKLYTDAGAAVFLAWLFGPPVG